MNKNEFIIREGEVGKKFYIIIYGEVAVFKKQKTEQDNNEIPSDLTCLTNI